MEVRQLCRFFSLDSRNLFALWRNFFLTREIIFLRMFLRTRGMQFWQIRWDFSQKPESFLFQYPKRIHNYNFISYKKSFIKFFRRRMECNFDSAANIFILKFFRTNLKVSRKKLPNSFLRTSEMESDNLPIFFLQGQKCLALCPKMTKEDFFLENSRKEFLMD